MALQQCGGAARWSGLRRLGVSEHAVRTDGRIKQIGRGAYALPEAPATVVTAVALGGVLSHLSAAALHGLDVWELPPLPHVTIPRGSSRSAPDAVVHVATLGPTDVDPWRPVTSLRRTLLDCGRTVPLPDGVVVLDSAIRGRLIECRELRILLLSC